MRWPLKGSKNDPKINWHSWFAWHPVIVLGKDGYVSEWLWLEIIQRRRIDRYEDTYWEYQG